MARKEQQSVMDHFYLVLVAGALLVSFLLAKNSMAGSWDHDGGIADGTIESIRLSAGNYAAKGCNKEDFSKELKRLMGSKTAIESLENQVAKTDYQKRILAIKLDPATYECLKGTIAILKKDRSDDALSAGSFAILHDTFVSEADSVKAKS